MSDDKVNELGLTFLEWKTEYEAAVYSLCGMSSDDLPDLIFIHDRWEGCEEPEETAQELVETSLGEMGYSLDDLKEIIGEDDDT